MTIRTPRIQRHDWNLQKLKEILRQPVICGVGAPTQRSNPDKSPMFKIDVPMRIRYARSFTAAVLVPISETRHAWTGRCDCSDSVWSLLLQQKNWTPPPLYLYYSEIHWFCTLWSVTMYRSSSAKKPNDYIYAISNHARRDMHTSLHPGVNYRHIAKFLQPAMQYSLSSTQLQRQHEQNQPKYPFVIVHDLAFSHGDIRRVTSFDGYTGREAFAQHSFPDSGSGHIVFVRGYPSAEWIGEIGARYGVDPELYHRYLTLTHSSEFYDLPALPSSSTNIISLSMPTIGKHMNSFPAGTDTMPALWSHFKNLDRLGQSVVREFSLHDDLHFSIEQQILICVTKRRSGGWNGKAPSSFVIHSVADWYSSNHSSWCGKKSWRRA